MHYLYGSIELSMRHLVAFSLLFFTLSGVQKNPHPDLLTSNQMVAVLVDLELSKAMIEHYTSDEEVASQLLKKNVLLICQSHHIAQDTFQQSCWHYLGQLEVMKKIYEEVIARLEELEKKSRDE